MYRLLFTPEWFNGWDIAFSIIGLIIALLIAAYSFRIYRISQEKKFLWFSLAFLLVSIAFLSTIVTSSVTYSQTAKNVADVLLGPAKGVNREYTQVFYRAGFFAQMVSMLGAWLLIFFISQKSRERTKRYYEVSQIALFLYLVLLISVVSNFKYFVFYLTSAVLLGLIVLNYYKNYLNTGKNKKALLVMFSFLLILFANIFFVFVFMFESFYVIGEILLLFGFLLLLYTYHKIVKI